MADRMQMNQNHVNFVEQRGEIHQPPASYSEAINAPKEELFPEVDGIKLHCWHWEASPDAPVVLLVHGNGASGHWFIYHGRRLQQLGYRVISMTFSGMGDSQWRDYYDRETMSNDIIGVIEALSLKNVFLVAHSFGGMVANVAAAKLQDKLAGLVICDHYPFPGEFQTEWFEGRPPARPTRVYATEQEIIKRFVLMPPQPCEHQYLVRDIALSSIRKVEGGYTWKFDPTIYDNMIIGKDHLAILNSHKIPLHLYCARWSLEQREWDEMKTTTDVEFPWQEWYKDVMPSTIEDEMGHHMMLDDPEGFVVELDNILKGLK